MNARKFVAPLTILGLAFYGGYLLGVNSKEAPSDEQNLAQGQAINEFAAPKMQPHAWSSFDDLLKQNEQNNNVFAEQTQSANEPADENTTEQSLDITAQEYQWEDPDDIIAMFNELITLSLPNTDKDVRSFGQAIDQLRAVLADSPAQLSIIIEHMQTLDPNSREFNYVTAVLQALPEQKGLQALERAALQASQRFDSASRQQFLHLVANTHNAADNPEILNSLVDIALYSDEASSTKLNALDLVMPFQVGSIERQQILSGLNGMLEDSEFDNKNAVVSHVLRFSNQEQRSTLASKYIGSSNDDELRYSILDGLHSGTVPRSDNIKQELLFIAQDPQDPMRDQAKHALMYVFDISNEEYRQIKDSSN